MRKITRRIIKTIADNKGKIAIMLLILAAYFINSLHTQFPDEFDNIYGGFLINQGKLPNVGFFTHHNPGAYYLASLITIITQRSFVHFRLIFAGLLYVFFLFSYYLLKKRVKGEKADYFLFYGTIIALGSTYWWGQMLLSETVVGNLMVLAALLVFTKRLKRIKFNIGDIIIISVLTFLSLFVSLTYIYLIPIFNVLVLYFYFLDNRKLAVKNLIKPFLIFALPYILFFVYLVLIGGLYEFYFQSIYYNVNYYIYNFPAVAGTISHNPLRYAVSIAYNTFNSLFALLTNVSTFNFSYPFNVSLAIANAAFFVFLIIKREYALTLMFLSLLVFTNARSEPLNIKETDFHATVYIMLTIATVSYLFYRLKDELSYGFTQFEKIIMGTTFSVTFVYWFFNIFFLTNQFANKAYGKYMGRDPLIYDRQQTAPTMNKILKRDDYYWMGPFELQELLFINGKIASKYYWFLPANSRDQKIMGEFITDLTRNRPKVIVFKKWWSNFGVKPEDFNKSVVSFLDNNYFSFADLNKPIMQYKAKVTRERDFDFETEYFFDKNRKDEIVKELLEKGLIEKI